MISTVRSEGQGCRCLHKLTSVLCCKQNATSDLNSTVVDFKMSALNEMRPAWEDVQRGANSFANSSVDVVSQGVYGVVHFGNKTWTSLQAAGTPALAPASGPTQVGHLLRHRWQPMDVPSLLWPPLSALEHTCLCGCQAWLYGLLWAQVSACGLSRPQCEVAHIAGMNAQPTLWCCTDRMLWMQQTPAH